MKMPKLSAREVVMLIFLVVLLIAVIYYMAFYTPLQAEIASIETEISNTDSQIASFQEKLSQMKRMQDELDQILAQPEDMISELPPYDNIVEILDDLDRYLRRHTETYTMTHSDPKITDDGTVRRYITLSLRCDDLDSAQDIITEFTDSKWRCIVENIELSSSNGNNIDIGEIGLQISLVFFELS